jgi:hypothetical protein
MPRKIGKDLIDRQRSHLKEVREAASERLKKADLLADAMRQQAGLIVRAYCLATVSQSRTRNLKMLKEADMHTESPYMGPLRELIERAQSGDQSAMPELRELLDDTPELWQQVGDAAKHVEVAWVKLLSGNDLLTQECLYREAERRRTELLGDNSTPIERHLVETIVASWLQLQHAEIQMADSREAPERRLNFLHRRLESAQKHHRAAINQLVKIREAVIATTKQKASDNTDRSRRNSQPSKRPRRRVVAA